MESLDELDGLPAWAANGTHVPIQGESTVTVRSWEDAAFDDADQFEAGLQALGLHSDEVAQGAQLLRSVDSEADDAVQAFWSRQPLKYYEAPDDLAAQAGQLYQYTRDGALTRFRNWFGGRQIVVDSRELVQVCLPLFVLSAYDAPGCVSTYQMTTEQSRKLGWNITILGSGLGGEATVTSSVTSTFTANAGEAVLIFVPVHVAVEQVHVVGKDGATLGSGQRVDVTPAMKEDPPPGARRLDASDLPAPGDTVHTYPLAGYGTGSPAEYQYPYTQQKVAQIQLGLTAYGASASLTGSASMTRSVTLDFKLAGGRDYRLCRLADAADGVTWG